jgi:hypothetical protein
MNMGFRNSGRGALTRSERTAEARRSRAHTHLQRVRGQQTPTLRPGWRLYAAAAAAAVVAGTAFGVSLANSAGWGPDGIPDAVFVHGAVRLSAAEVASAARAGADGADAPDAVAEQIAGHAWIADARALHLPGGALLVTVTEAVPLAVSAAGENGEDYLVDADGVPFALADAAQARALLRVVAPETLAPNEANAGLAAAVAFAGSLPARGLGRPTEVAFNADGAREGYALRLEGLAPRVLLGTEELDSKLASLAEILAAGLPGLAEAAELDLRFAGQAVLRNEPSHEGAAQAAVTRGRAEPST